MKIVLLDLLIMTELGIEHVELKVHRTGQWYRGMKFQDVDPVYYNNVLYGCFGWSSRELDIYAIDENRNKISVMKVRKKELLYMGRCEEQLILVTRDVAHQHQNPLHGSSPDPSRVDIESHCLLTGQMSSRWRLRTHYPQNTVAFCAANEQIYFVENYFSNILFIYTIYGKRVMARDINKILLKHQVVKFNHASQATLNSYVKNISMTSSPDIIVLSSLLDNVVRILALNITSWQVVWSHVILDQPYYNLCSLDKGLLGFCYLSTEKPYIEIWDGLSGISSLVSSSVLTIE